MLTSLSRSFRRLLDTALGRALAAASKAAGDSPALLPGCAAPARGGLRLLRSADAAVEHPDTSITALPAGAAAPASLPGASAFVAGAGARIYSLDAFRPGRPRTPRAPRAA